MLTVLVFARSCENDNGRLFGFFLFMNMFALFVDQIVLHLSILQYKNKTKQFHNCMCLDFLKVKDMEDVSLQPSYRNNFVLMLHNFIHFFGKFYLCF